MQLPSPPRKASARKIAARGDWAWGGRPCPQSTRSGQTGDTPPSTQEEDPGDRGPGQGRSAGGVGEAWGGTSSAGPVDVCMLDPFTIEPASSCSHRSGQPSSGPPISTTTNSVRSEYAGHRSQRPGPQPTRAHFPEENERGTLERSNNESALSAKIDDVFERMYQCNVMERLGHQFVESRASRLR